MENVHHVAEWQQLHRNLVTHVQEIHILLQQTRMFRAEEFLRPEEVLLKGRRTIITGHGGIHSNHLIRILRGIHQMMHGTIRGRDRVRILSIGMIQIQLLARREATVPLMVAVEEQRVRVRRQVQDQMEERGVEIKTILS